MVHLKARFPWR